MIVNAYAVLVLLLNLLRFPAAVVVLLVGLPAAIRCSAALRSDERKDIEDRFYLLFMLVVFLLGLNVVSWPLLYWLLQSYVPEWPGVMCIYGVTQVGTGSVGVEGTLPTVIKALQLLKPALIFVSGAWFVLYWINRRTQTAALTQRMLVGVVLLGTISLADSALEISYVVIPKRENLPNAGCCSAMQSEALSNRFSAAGWFPASQSRWLCGAYYATNGLLVLMLLSHFSAFYRHRRNLWLLAMLVALSVTIPISFFFLIDVAAPAILHLPLHHCAYDLITVAPESVLGIALFALGSFSIGWACVAAWIAWRPETSKLLTEAVDRALFLALFCFSASLVLFSVEMALS